MLVCLILAAVATDAYGQRAPRRTRGAKAASVESWLVGDAWSRDREARARKALEADVFVEFFDVPLDEAVAYLAKSGGVPILIDKTELEETGTEPDCAVTLVVGETRVGAALALLLETLELGFTFRQGVLWVSTPEWLEEHLTTRIYPIADLVDKADDGWVDYEMLIEMITTTIAPDSWEDVGGTGTIGAYRGTLTVSQTWPNQLDVEHLLAGLRAKGSDDLPTTLAAPIVERPRYRSLLVRKY